MAQITITLTLPDNKQSAVLDAYCIKYGYDATSGLTKLQFLKKEIANYLKEPYNQGVQEEQSRLARVTAANDINSFEIS